MKNKISLEMAHIFLELYIMENIAMPGTAKNEYLAKQIKRYGLDSGVHRGVIKLSDAEHFIKRLARKTDALLKR